MAEIETALLNSLNTFLAFARKRLNDPELAADAVQDALLKALKSPDAPSEDEKLVPWFYQILRRTIIDLYRRKATRSEALEAFANEQSAASAEDEQWVCQCFRPLIATLPGQYAEVLNAVDLEGREPKQVAEDLDLTWNNLNVRLHRARTALRKRLEETCEACSAHGCLNCTCSESTSPAVR
jgi:RNA polymerase sigma factor (sigma-70 family)